jgi:hypothetical protein
VIDVETFVGNISNWKEETKPNSDRVLSSIHPRLFVSHESHSSGISLVRLKSQVQLIVAPPNGVERVDVRSLLNISERESLISETKSRNPTTVCWLLPQKVRPTTSKSLVRRTPPKHEHEQLFETLFEHQKTVGRHNGNQARCQW